MPIRPGGVSYDYLEKRLQETNSSLSILKFKDFSSFPLEVEEGMLALNLEDDRIYAFDPVRGWLPTGLNRTDTDQVYMTKEQLRQLDGGSF